MPTVDEVLTLAVDELEPLKRPVMLVALTGLFDIAGVATTALDEFAPPEFSVTVGEIDPDPFYDFTQARPYVTTDESDERVIQWPDNRFDVVRDHGDRDLVVVVGNEPHLYWRTYSEAIASVARTLGCEAVVTVGSSAEAVPHTRPPLVTGSTTDAALAAALGIGTPTYQGLTGVAGVLQAHLASVGLPAVSLRVAIPHYLMNADHPGSVLALQTHLAHVLGVPMLVADDDDMAEIEQAAQLHQQLADSDPQLRQYVQMLERDFDHKNEARIPTADDIGAQFEAFLKSQRDDD